MLQLLQMRLRFSMFADTMRITNVCIVVVVVVVVIIIIMTDKWTAYLESGGHIDTIYSDFRRGLW